MVKYEQAVNKEESGKRSWKEYGSKDDRKEERHR
jgi:hypothetical protein